MKSEEHCVERKLIKQVHQILNGIFYVNFDINFKQDTANLEGNLLYKRVFSLLGDNSYLEFNGSPFLFHAFIIRDFPLSNKAKKIEGLRNEKARYRSIIMSSINFFSQPDI